MAKKADMFYYETLEKSADCACRAATILENVIENFNSENLVDKIKEMHAVENEADEYNHAIMEALTRAFITPIEREDLLEISNRIDDLVDFIEDILLYIFMLNVKTIRPEAVEFARLVKVSTEHVKSAIRELSNFKKSKKIKEEIIEINHLEEEGDRLFIKSMRALHTSDIEPIVIIRWKDILDKFEKCLDGTEETARVIDGVVMKNS